MEPVKVLQVLEKISVNSGVWAVVNSYDTRMDHSRITFDFMVHEQVEPELKLAIEEKGSKIYVMPRLRLKNTVQYIKALRLFFTEHPEYRIVHGHAPNAAFFYLGAAKRAGVPIRIVHSHNSKGADGRIKKIRNYILNRLGIRQANCWFACSKKAAAYLYGKSKADKAVIMNNAVDVKKYLYSEKTREKMRKSMSLEGKLVIGHVGRFAEQKNQKYFIEIAKIMKEKGIQAVFVLIGDGEQRENIEEQVKQEKLESFFYFTGSIYNVEEYLQMMDVFALPSLYEGLPVVGVEAQAAGLPCLFSDAVTTETAMTDYAYFISLEQPELWVEKILELGSKPRNEKAGAQICQCGYDIEEEAGKLEKKYMELIGRTLS